MRTSAFTPDCGINDQEQMSASMQVLKNSGREAAPAPDEMDFQILEQISDSAGSSIHRARLLLSGLPILVKVLKLKAALPEQVLSLRNEYAILKSLDLPHVVKPIALIESPQSLSTLLEVAGGESFDLLLAGPRLEIVSCLRAACQLARTLAGLHLANIVHRDIRPANLMLMPGFNICLFDFQRATLDFETVHEPASGVGDWHYISPEQTGRVNHPVDYRTDLYSAGVVLYQMLTGQLPFHGSDALELAHGHVARLPRPPSDLNPAIPAVLSAIVMKLLEKMPADRYQRAEGLLHDLQGCLAQWEAGGTIVPFELAAQDWSDGLKVSHQLFSRTDETEKLLAGFEMMQTSGRAALLLVSGDAGVGKSALVRELHQPVLARSGYFLSGKFDQYQRDIPYATVTQAFRELVRQILAESEARIADWRWQIRQAVGANGQLIVDVLPQLALIIGPQTTVPELPPAETQNRFGTVFKDFISVFAQAAHPLALFLDDLQWADTASLRLVTELLISSDKRFLLVIGAFRDNEVGPSHPLTLALGQIRTVVSNVDLIALAPLSEEALGSLIQDKLHCDAQAARPLTRLVYEKTAGNPFFVIQFLKALVDERMLTYSAAQKTWRWDISKIKAKGYTDNVAQLMIQKLARLPNSVQAVLQRLACLGSSAAEKTLVGVCTQTESATIAALSAAIARGLLVRAGNTVSFSHDRVQEAAYLSMSADTRVGLHLELGRRLLAGKTSAQVEDAIFDIAGQFNQGAECVHDEKEKALLCQLNLLAGRKAKAAVAYASARRFLTLAYALLPEDSWESQYADSFAISLALGECEFLTGNFERAEQLAEQILSRARSNRDRASVYRLRTQLYQMGGSYDDALASMASAARLFDVDFPPAGVEMEAAIEAEAREIAVLLTARTIAGFADAPPLVDANIATVVGLLVETIPAAYLTRPDYFALITAKATRLSLQYGSTEDACFAYSTYGMSLLSRHQDIATAFEYSEMALKLNERLDGRRLKGRVLVAHALAFSPWKNSFSNSSDVLNQAFAASVEVGDLLYANFSALFYCWPMLQQGVKLKDVWITACEKAAFARDSRNDAVYQAIRFQQQLVANLKGRTQHWSSLNDADFDEALSFAALEKANMGFGLQIAHIVRQMSAFIYGDYASAWVAGQQASSKSYEGNGMILVDSAHHLYYALTLAALYPQASDSEKMSFAATLAEELERYKVWADHNPQNFRYGHELVGAEIARIEGRDLDAARLYDQALGSCRENGFVHYEAITFEVASKFYREGGFQLIADAYLREARACYLRWGADGKVAQLDVLWPQLRPHNPPVSGQVEPGALSQLDVLSVVKASQAISGQLVLEVLADTLMQIVLKNAGAQTGALLLCGKEGLELAAQASADGPTVQVSLDSRSAPDASFFPVGILNYVQRSRERVVLTDIAQHNPFSTDPYFTELQPKSILCLPILRQNALIGLLYLENKRVHAFAPKRVAVLELLAAQAAISLENAQLYSKLVEENIERKRVEEALVETDRRKDEFLAMLAHELRNPLAPISSSAQLLSLMKHEDKRIQKASEIILRQAQHMTSLVNDLLDVSRVTTGLVVLDRQPVDLNRIVAEAIEQVQPLINSRRHVLTLEAFSVAAVVLGDHKRLVQALSNLLQNAAKYTPEGGNISLQIANTENEVVVTLRDDGIGISPELLPHVFKLFTQDKRSPDRSQGGLGLGLALVKSIVTLHGGRIHAVSEGNGSGAVFCLGFPLLTRSNDTGTVNI